MSQGHVLNCLLSPLNNQILSAFSIHVIAKASCSSSCFACQKAHQDVESRVISKVEDKQREIQSGTEK